MKKRYEILFVLICVICAIRGSSFADVGSQITQGGAAYEIATPFAQEDLFEIQYIQSADVMYLVHNNYPPQLLSRYGDTNWTIEDVNLDRGPFMRQNTSEGWTITPSGETGDITLTASLDTFNAGHVGSLWRLTHTADANSVSGTFTGNGSSSTVEVQMNREFHVITAGHWNATITIERSYDAGATWVGVYPYTRVDSGQLNYYGTETVADALYRVTMSAWVSNPEWYCEYRITVLSHEVQGIVQVTGVSDARHADAAVLYDLAGTTATYKWAEGAFSEYRGYPAAVTFYQERLVFGGTKYQPQTIWMSQTDDWHNFLNNNLDSGALSYTIAADQVNAIRWLVGQKALLIGTSGAEWKLSPPPGKALAASIVPELTRQSNYGSEQIQALAVNDSVLFAQRQGKKIRQMRYAFDSDAYVSPDISVLAEHLTARGIKEMAFQRAPYTILWVVTDDGDLLSLTLEESQEVVGWAKHTFDGDCESVAVIPGDGEDEVWIIVKRTIEGVDYRYIEQFQPFDWGGDDADAFFVDCGLSWSGGAAVGVTRITQADPMVVTAPGHSLTDGQRIRFADVGGMTQLNSKVFTVSTVTGSSFQVRDKTDAVDVNSVGFTAYTSGGTVIHVAAAFTGLDHLDGETVVAAADASYAGSFTVASGTVTLGDYYNKVHIGLPYTAKIKPMRLEFTQTAGGLQGLTKRITATTMRLYNTLDADIGPTWTKYDSLIFRKSSDPLNAAPPYFTGDKRILFRGPWETAGDICAQSSLPLPFTLIALIVEYEANE